MIEVGGFATTGNPGKAGSEMDELKPCFMCETILDRVYTYTLEEPKEWCIRCFMCGLDTGWYESKEELLKRWNTRHEEPTK